MLLEVMLKGKVLVVMQTKVDDVAGPLLTFPRLVWFIVTYRVEAVVAEEAHLTDKRPAPVGVPGRRKS